MSIFSRRTATTEPAAPVFDAGTTAVEDISGSYTIDASHTRVGFSARHAMVTTVRGAFKAFEGSAVIDTATPANSKVELSIDVASIDTGVADRDGHLRSADFLDGEKHPAITFRSKRVEGSPKKEGDAFKVVGDLSIRGTKREVTLDAVYEGRGTDPWGGTRVGIRATTKIDRRDWGLTWNQALETGGILVGNDVRIELEVQVVKAVAAHA